MKHLHINKRFISLLVDDGELSRKWVTLNHFCNQIYFENINHELYFSPMWYFNSFNFYKL